MKHLILDNGENQYVSSLIVTDDHSLLKTYLKILFNLRLITAV